MKALLFVIPAYVVLFFFYGLKNPKRFLLLTGIVSLPFRTDYLLSGVDDHEGWSSGIILALSDLSFILLFCYIIFNMRGFRRASSTIVVPSIFFILACILSTFNSTAGTFTFYQVAMLSKILFLYYIVAVNVIYSEEDLNCVLLFLTISLFLQGAIGCIQFATGWELDMFSTGKKAGGLFSQVPLWGSFRRVFGTQYGRPNSYASYLFPLLLLNLALVFGVKRNTKLRNVTCALGFLGLLFSFSRGGWLSFFVGVVALLIFFKAKRIRMPRIVYAALLIGLVLVIAFLPLLKERVTRDDAQAATSRLPLFKLAMNMIKEYPIMGVGGNTFANVIKQYTTADLRGEYLYQVHNEYMLILAETGVIGLSCFLWLIYCIFKIGLQCVRHQHNRLIQFTGIGGVVGCIALLVHMQVDLYTSRVQWGSIYLMCAVFTAGGRLGAESKNAERLSRRVEALK